MAMHPRDDAALDMAELPKGWRILPSGVPAPDWVAALDEARDRGLAESAGTMEPWPTPPKPTNLPSNDERR